MKSVGELLAGPLFELAFIDKFDSRLGRKRLPDEIAIAGSMRLKMEFDRSLGVS